MKQILFVDDEPEFVRPQVDALMSNGYEVILKTNADEAFDFLSIHKPDLIILDLIMPPRKADASKNTSAPDFVETGVKLHHAIREDLRLVDVPIVFLSVVRDQQIRHELSTFERRYFPHVRFLTKPISSGEVVAEVQEALGEFGAAAK